MHHAWKIVFVLHNTMLIATNTNCLKCWPFMAKFYVGCFPFTEEMNFVGRYDNDKREMIKFRG